MTQGEREQASIRAMEQQILAVTGGPWLRSADGVVRLQFLVQAHADELRAARLGGAKLRLLANGSATSVSAHLGDALLPQLLARFAELLPISEADAVARGDRDAVAADYADAIGAIFAWEAAIGPDSRLRAAIQGQLGAVTRLCRSRIETHLRGRGDDDFPDVRILARDILRVEAVEWAVGIAGGPQLAAELRHLAHHAARQAVQWAGRVFERFKADPDEFTHFDAVATLSAVDDLLVVVLRVLESDREDRLAGSHPFVLTLGEQALQDFAKGLEHMSRRYLAIVDVHLLSTGTGGEFVLSVLQLLQRVLRLGQALMRSVEIVEIQINHRATHRRMVAFRSRLRAALGEPDAPRELAARLAVLEDALIEAAA